MYINNKRKDLQKNTKQIPHNGRNPKKFLVSHFSTTLNFMVFRYSSTTARRGCYMRFSKVKNLRKQANLANHTTVIWSKQSATYSRWFYIYLYATTTKR